jgi:integrase
MGVKVRPYLNGGWEVDVVLTLPDGRKIRDRRKAPVSTRTEALRWGRERERELLLRGPQIQRKEVPTLNEFAPRFLDGYATANRQKPSGIAAKETVLRIHLLPRLGAKRLDEITNEDVQLLKSKLRGKATKTVNNVLSVLKTLLGVALEWGVIDRVPCTVRLLRTTNPSEAVFHDFDEFERLVDAARRIDGRTLLIVLLGGEAGLRCGELMALEWTDIDLSKRQLWVRRSEWKGEVTVPKGGRPRLVPLTSRLAETLQTQRHLRGDRVLAHEDGQPLTQKVVRGHVQRAARLANLANRGVHVLRHTFCSHLAMRGAPARAIQELAGHKDLSTTQRYMHLSPRAIEEAIRMLEGPPPPQVRGGIVEAAGIPESTRRDRSR